MWKTIKKCSSPDLFSRPGHISRHNGDIKKTFEFRKVSEKNIGPIGSAVYRIPTATNKQTKQIYVDIFPRLNKVNFRVHVLKVNSPSKLE